MTVEATNATDDLGQLMTEYWNFHLDEDPAKALEIAPHEGIDRYSRSSMADYERRRGTCQAFRNRLSRIDAQALDADDRVNYEVLANEIEMMIEDYDLMGHLRPMWFPAGPEMMMSWTIRKDNLKTGPGVEAYVGRLRSVPEYFDGVRERLLAGIEQGFRLPEPLLRPMLGNADAMLREPADDDAFWFEPLKRLHETNSSELDAARQAIEAEVRQSVLPAFQAYADLLRHVLAKHCRSSTSCMDDPDGRAYYEAQVRHLADTDMPPEDIHEVGLEEVERIRAAMETIAGRCEAHADADAMRSHLLEEPGFRLESREALLARIKVLAKDIDSQIPELFGAIPRSTYGVEAIPEDIAEQMPPAYAEPNPADGSQAGTFWITSLPERCPTYMHVPLTLHEAWPGHLMHIALLQENPALPDFRRYQYLNYQTLLEGWALYCERLGVEFGLYDNEYDALGQLEMEMWRAVRLVVDTGIHLHRWSRERAVNYMQENLTLPAEVIASEVDRYIGMPAQALSYKIGELKIRNLRSHAESVLGERFDLRGFHDCLMTAGAVPMKVMEGKVLEWMSVAPGAAR